MKRLTGAIYKYCEMTGMDDWNEAFDNNVLVKNFNDLRCYLTPDGIVLCYERYENILLPIYQKSIGGNWQRRELVYWYVDFLKLYSPQKE